MNRSIVGAIGASLITAFVVSSGAIATSPPTPDGGTGYEATIVRDDRGVAHITAADWGSIGYGQGYAFAEDRVCTLIDQVVKVRGERSKYHGRGEGDTNVNSDFAYRHLGLWDEAPTRWADQPERVVQVVDGYVAGFNAALDAGAATGQWCDGAAWVGPITTQDLYAYVGDVLMLASSRNLLDPIANATAPAAAEPSASEPAGLRTLGQSPGASNGWALGEDRSTTGGGLLLANPHFPWEGELRFWENHLTIPGELNVYGAALSGLPGVQIGFNDAVGWTHTVSAGHRFNLYRYDLDPADPTTYLVDGVGEAMTPTTITIEISEDGAESYTEERTLYRTKHGPLVSLDPLAWSTDQAFAIGDANAQITRVLEQFLRMDSASSMDEFQAVHEEVQGIPWVNTISTSADGRAWIVDVSATPNLSPEAVGALEADLEAGGLTSLVYDQAGIYLLDGSNSIFDWVDDPTAPAPGLIPFAQTPQLERSDYVFNANDSYWLSNPHELVTGFSPLQGAEETPQTARTRTNVLLLEDDRPWSIDDVQNALFSDRTILAEQLREPLVAACTAQPTVPLAGVDIDVSESCEVLAAWDGTFTLDARGAIIFREWLAQFDWEEYSDTGALFADGFDPTNPAGSPSVPADDAAGWLERLARAQQYLHFVGIPLDAPLGDWQFEVRTGTQIPIHGGNGYDGVANIMDCCAEASSLAPMPDHGEYVFDPSELRSIPGQGFGYPITYGASFVMSLQYGPDGPVAEGFLTYGNPDDPTDPAYRFGLDAFSAGEWQPFRFTADDVAAAAVASQTVSG